MTDPKNILIVRIPAGDIPALEAMRDYIHASLQLGVVVVPEDTTLELMELPPLGWVMSEEYYQALEEAFEEPEPEPSVPEPVLLESALPEKIRFTGKGAEEKESIYWHMRRYREKHGLGCWQAVAQAAGKDVTPDLLRSITIGALSPPIGVWRRIDKALAKLEAEEEAKT